MQSNAYTLIFTWITTIILGFLLSYVSTSLKETQQINEEIDIMKNILYSLEFSEKDGSWTGEEVKKFVATIYYLVRNYHSNLFRN